MHMAQSFYINPKPNPNTTLRSSSISTNLYRFENTNPNVVVGTIVGNKPPKKSVNFVEPLPIDFKELDNKVEKLLSNINMIKGAIALYSMNNDEASYLKLVKYINYMTELQHQFDNIMCK